MIERQKEGYATGEIDAVLHPLVLEWFRSSFPSYSPPQCFSIVNIHRRMNTLISSPTGSGKTLSAFLAIINELVVASVNGTLEDRIYAVYVSPLKALGNDIKRNLTRPLAAIAELAEAKGIDLDIRVAVRSGDTTPAERARMRKTPPHILITTPESLGILLTTTVFRSFLTSVSWVIVDEIHALAENKRGSHLSLTLERLEVASPGLCRVALSATVRPLEDVARFLVGQSAPGVWRDCRVVDVNFLKRLDLKVLSPVRNLIREEYESIARKTYELMDRLIQDHGTTLIFTNTRAATERVVHYLKERFPRNYAAFDEGSSVGAPIAAHHGSLSREHRLEVEERLKRGELKVVVSSTSLELGIDIGAIDLVILLGSPKGVARALQRIGRSGHQLRSEAKGRIIVQDRDDLVECSVLLKSALEGRLDTLSIPRAPLDVLSQQVMGIAIERILPVAELFDMVRRAFPYVGLSRKDFDDVLSYLSGEYVSLEDRHVYAKIWKDESSGMVGKRGKLARLIFMTNIGTIPDETNVTVKVGDVPIGQISEPFLERLHSGDVFVLGGATYEFRHSLGLTARVRSAVGRRPTVPQWHSEMLPLAYDLACAIGRFRSFMENYFAARKSREEIIAFINEYLLVDARGAESIYEYFAEQFRYALIPHAGRLLIEHYQDGGNRYVLFHALYGRRVNDVLARCVAFVIGRVQQRDVEIMITDTGFAVRTTGSVQAARALRLLRSDELPRIAQQSLERTEILARRFRHCAARALMILRNYKGRSKSVGRQQMSSRLLLSAVRRIDPDFVVLREARREVLEDVMDVRHAVEVIRAVEEGKLSLQEIHRDVPSPFAFNLLLSGYADILKMDDRQAFLRKMHELVLAKISLQDDAPLDVVEQAKVNPAFDYEVFWGRSRDRKVLSEEELTDALLQDLRVAARKASLDQNVLYDLQQLIVRRAEPRAPGSKGYRFRPETVAFVSSLLAGPVPKCWTDRLVKLLMRSREEMSWQVSDQ